MSVRNGLEPKVLKNEELLSSFFEKTQKDGECHPFEACRPPFVYTPKPFDTVRVRGLLCVVTIGFLLFILGCSYIIDAVCNNYITTKRGNLMKNKSKKNFIITGALFLLFIIFTILVIKVDVQPIGPEQSTVGLASLNQFMRNRLGTNLLWYDITDWLGVIAILFALGFGLLGFCQFIKRKSLLKVDYPILLLGIFYILVVTLYLLFEFVIVNYRPIILETNLEASYPSSHAMIVTCIMSTAILQFHRSFPKHKAVPVVLDSISILLIAITVIGRLISGVHWFTDIIAGVILSSALVMLYYSAVSAVAQKHRNAAARKKTTPISL